MADALAARLAGVRLDAEGVPPRFAWNEQLDVASGPARPEDAPDFDAFRTPGYLDRFAAKMVHDLAKWARLYNGKLVRLFHPVPGARCTYCTDALTGDRVVVNCPVCHGTGFAAGYAFQGEFWAILDVIARYREETALGSVDNPGLARDSVVLIGAPLLHDDDLVVTVDTKEVLKVVHVEPQFVALQGRVITQNLGCSRISRGSVEYAVVTW